MYIPSYCCLLGGESGDLKLTISAPTVYEQFLSKDVGAVLEVSLSFVSLLKIYRNINSEKRILHQIFL